MILSEMFYLNFHLFTTDKLHIVGNKAKGQILKRLLQESKSTPNFPKNEHFLLPCAYQGVRNVRFSENVAYFIFL